MACDADQARRWMDLASAGDDGAFASLAVAMQDSLYRFCLAHGLYAADAAEAVQETFFRAYRARRQWRTGGDATVWLCGIALNVVREQWRRKRRETPAGLDPAVVETAEMPAADANGVGDIGIRRLAKAMKQLPDRQRLALTCRFLRRMSVRQTAEIMGCAEGTVKAAVFAALENLRKMLRQGI